MAMTMTKAMTMRMTMAMAMAKTTTATMCAMLAAGALAAAAQAAPPAAAPAASAPLHGPTWGQHGMALFGDSEGLYASHLPMFHAPHDVQVVLRVRAADPALDAALRRRLGAAVALWTIDPERFEIDRLAPGAAAPLRAFRADVVEGHFEQGGATRYAGAQLLVEQVLVYRKLSDRPGVAAQARYYQFGAGKRRYLVKEIDSRPDFEHIVALRAGAATPLGPVSIPKRALERPADADLARALPGARIDGTVYFDTRDLK